MKGHLIMKLFWLGSLRDELLGEILFKSLSRNRNELSYQEMKKSVDATFINYFSTGWCNALRSIGYCVEHVEVKSNLLQRKWMQENSLFQNEITLEKILFLQIQKFRPDVIFVDDFCTANFVRELRAKIPSLRVVFGWSGSAVARDPRKHDFFKSLDLVLSCAPESTAYLRDRGANAVHINHAFPIHILPFLSYQAEKESGILFSGSLVRGKNYHLMREQLLLNIVKKCPLVLYTPSANFSGIDLAKYLLKFGLYQIMKLLPVTAQKGISALHPRFQGICFAQDSPLCPVNRSLLPFMRPPVYGVEMFQSLLNAEVILNIHADSSPEYASNMKLFEATGVGSCLLTDSKKNMSDLFVPDKEVVTYHSVDDCIEKAQWLMEHPVKREEIAEAGAKRCRKEHTYMNRVRVFDQILRQMI